MEQKAKQEQLAGDFKVLLEMARNARRRARETNRSQRMQQKVQDVKDVEKLTKNTSTYMRDVLFDRING